MSAVWTSAISGAWTVAADVMGDLLPVLGVALGLAILGFLVKVVVGMVKG